MVGVNIGWRQDADGQRLRHRGEAGLTPGVTRAHGDRTVCCLVEELRVSPGVVERDQEVAYRHPPRWMHGHRQPGRPLGTPTSSSALGMGTVVAGNGQFPATVGSRGQAPMEPVSSWTRRRRPLSHAVVDVLRLYPHRLQGGLPAEPLSRLGGRAGAGRWSGAGGHGAAHRGSGSSQRARPDPAAWRPCRHRAGR